MTIRLESSSRRIGGLSKLLAGAALAVLASAGAQDMPIEDAIKARQAGLRDMGGAFKGINDELKKSQPALPAIRQYAQQIEDLAQQQKFWFPEGSGPESEIKTAAKPEIWSRTKDFVAAREKLIVEAAAFVKVTAGSDLGAIRAQTRVVGMVCKGCHDPFREEED
jgi:cytochrome c556